MSLRFIDNPSDADEPEEFYRLSLIEQGRLLDWIKSNIRKSKSAYSGSSYGLKHIFKSESGLYVTNGAFKGAMQHAGFRPLNRNSQNWRFKIELRTPALVSLPNNIGSKRVNFVRWLYQQSLTGRDDVVSDLACDCRQDRRWFDVDQNPSIREVFRYFRENIGLPQYLEDAICEAYREFKQVTGVYPRNKKKDASVSLRKRYTVFKRDGYCCRICGRSVNDGVVLEVDHKVPRSWGGNSNLENLWTLCFDCNRGKADSYL